MQDLSRKFIIAYLAELRHKSSVIPVKDRGHFPSYWWKPYKVSITVATNSEAINLDRPVKKKFDQISFKQAVGHIESVIFNNLDYKIPAGWVVNGDSNSIGHLTMESNSQPFFYLSAGAVLKIYDVRFEQTRKLDGYPKEKSLLWMFSSPYSIERVSIAKAQSEAVDDFLGYLEWLFFTKWHSSNLVTILSSNTIDYILEALENLRRVYSNLITRGDIDEEILQQFLEEHTILLSPNRTVTKLKRVLGPYIPDFVVQDEDGSITLVELQLNTDELFHGKTISAGMKDATDQVKKWLDWLAKNEAHRLNTTEALIVIGRKSALDQHNDKVNSLINSIGQKIRLVSYDGLLESLDQLIATFKQSK